MPPERTKPKPFKAPRPSASTTRSTRATSTTSTDSDPFSSPPAQARSTSKASKAQSTPKNRTSAAASSSAAIPILSEDEDEAEPKAKIPPELLTKILHEFFAQDGTRMSKDAGLAVGKYMEVFVREAIARAAFERGQANGGNGVGDDFLEVEDLEKLAPQLLLDF